MKWKSKFEIIIDGEIIKYRLFKDNSILSVKDVIHYWKSDHSFQLFYNQVLASSQFEAFYWENPPMTMNIRQDAIFIVPITVTKESNFSHIGKFVRTAAKDQIHEFWEKVGISYEKVISNKPKWLSTAGLGVYWLHVRIDSRPKYYKFDSYK